MDVFPFLPAQLVYRICALDYKGPGHAVVVFVTAIVSGSLSIFPLIIIIATRAGRRADPHLSSRLVQTPSAHGASQFSVLLLQILGSCSNLVRQVEQPPPS